MVIGCVFTFLVASNISTTSEGTVYSLTKEALATIRRSHDFEYKKPLIVWMFAIYFPEPTKDKVRPFWLFK
jgi:hypothetical protein